VAVHRWSALVCSGVILFCFVPSVLHSAVPAMRLEGSIHLMFYIAILQGYLFVLFWRLEADLGGCWEARSCYLGSTVHWRLEADLPMPDSAFASVLPPPPACILCPVGGLMHSGRLPGRLGWRSGACISAFRLECLGGYRLFYWSAWSGVRLPVPLPGG